MYFPPRSLGPYRLSAAVSVVALAVGLAATSTLTGCQSPPPQSLVERGEAALVEGDLERADALFQSSLVESPNDGRTLLGLARVRSAAHDPEGALGIYREMARVAEPYFRGEARLDYAETLLIAGQLRLRRGRSHDALAVLRVLQKMDPTHKGLAPVLGDSLIAEASRVQFQAHMEEALELYTEATRVAPQRAQSFVAAAEMLLASNRNAEAKALLIRAREYHPNNRQIQALTLASMGVYR